MKRFLLMLLAAAVVAFGQAPPGPDKLTEKVIEVKYGEVSRIARMLRLYTPNVDSDDRLRVISVRGNAETLAKIDEVVKKLDVPPINVELTVYLVSGSMQSVADQLPESLAATAKQLHGVFAYKSYRMLESFVMRGRDGMGSNTSGVLPTNRALYDFKYRTISVSEGNPRIMNISGLDLGYGAKKMSADGSKSYFDVNIRTDVDVREGQKVVVGKSSGDVSGDALILVVTAKVVE